MCSPALAKEKLVRMSSFKAMVERERVSIIYHIPQNKTINVFYNNLSPKMSEPSEFIILEQGITIHKVCFIKYIYGYR